MQKLLLSLLLLLCAFAQHSPIQQADKAAADEVAPAGWLADVSQQIWQSEYHIRFQEKVGTYQSPNREQGLRFTFRPDGFSAEPRVAGTAQWQTQINLAHIGRQGFAQLQPEQTATVRNTNNVLEYTHSDGFRVQFDNQQHGMRQNFVLDTRPEGEGPVRVQLRVAGDLDAAQLSATEIALTQPGPHGAVETAMRYNDLKVWDANGTTCPAHMELDAENDLLALVVDDAQASYPLTIDPLSTSSLWNTEGNQVNAQYGVSVAPAGDVNGDGFGDVMVGAHLYDNGQNNEGRAFVFHGAATGPSTTADWTAEGNQAAAFFGFSCNTAGDVNGDGFSDVIIGAYLFDNGQSNEGRAYVYHGSGTGLSLTPDWNVESNQANSKFGFSVATAGDVNGDGFSDVVVGAYDYDNGQSNEGRAFVYHGSAGGLSGTADWTDESDQASAAFGKSVACAGDVNGDGFTDVIIGVQYYDNGEANEGAAMVYHGSGTGLSATPDQTVESDQASAEMGRTVAGAGDVNGDGYADVIVSAHLYDNGQTNEGRAQVYHGSATGISGTPDWTVEKNQANASFSVSVATAGDVNADGYADVIIGAHFYDNGTTDEGAAFVYHGSSTGLSVTEDWSVSSGQGTARFGQAVASAGDINGDGHSDVIVGAPTNDQGQVDEGRTFIYPGSPAGLATTSLWSTDANQDDASYGFSVACAGDVNFDGFSDVIVGAPNYDNGEANEGRAFVYFGSFTGPSGTADWTAESNQASAQFGFSVAHAGDVNGDGFTDVIVGAPGFDNGNTNEGAAFVYHGSVAGPAVAASWTTEGNQDNAAYGTSVNTAGDVNGDGFHDAIIGAPTYTNGESNEGRAFVYHGSGTGLSGTSDWTDESDQANANYGISVAVAGDVNGDGYTDVIIGANQYDNGQADEGRAFVYHGSMTGLSLTSDWTSESNQVSANFGVSVNSAGDVNGDGFSDVIIGADLYNNGQADEGRAFVYQGSGAGLAGAASWTTESNQANAHYGISVSSAGDVNGDGYSDVIVGADDYDNGQSNEGGAFVYRGSSAGLSTTASWTSEADQADANMGFSVAAAGDVDGDGYSDVLVGTPNFDNGNTNEGQVLAFSGNEGSNNRGWVRLLDNDESSALTSASFNDPSFGVGVFGRSPMGRSRAGLFWETQAPGAGFSTGTDLTNSVSVTNQDNTYSLLDLTGSEITAAVNKEVILTKVRMRMKFDPTTAFDGRILGPWIYHQPYLRGSSGGPLPVELVQFDVSYVEADDKVEIRWATASELNNDRFVVEKSINGRSYQPLATVKGAGTTTEPRNYSVYDTDPGTGTLYYRLRQIDLDGSQQVSAARVVRIRTNVETLEVSLYPNPATDVVALSGAIPEGSTINVFALNGKLVHSARIGSQPATLEVRSWEPGMYFVVVQSEIGQAVSRLVVN